MSVAAPFGLADLLERAGARICSRGRADCPQCKRQRAVSFNESKGLYHCFGADCDFSGGLASLRRLGIRQWLPRDEYIRQCQERERAERDRCRRYSLARRRWTESLDELHALNRLEQKAHDVGPDHPATWNALALVYREHREVEAALDYVDDILGRLKVGNAARR